MSSSENDEALAYACSLLEQALPRVTLEMGETGEGKWIQLPPSPGADYRWSFWFYPNGERHIYANLVAAAPADREKELVLWYHPFELEAFKGSRAELAQAFESELRLVVHSRTRVTQQRGLVNWTIDLDREDPPGEWQRVYRFFALRAGWKSPNGDEESATYFAPGFKEGIATG